MKSGCFYCNDNQLGQVCNNNTAILNVLSGAYDPYNSAGTFKLLSTHMVPVKNDTAACLILLGMQFT